MSNTMIKSGFLALLEQVAKEVQQVNKNIKIHIITFDFNLKHSVKEYQEVFGEFLGPFSKSPQVAHFQLQNPQVPAFLNRATDETSAPRSLRESTYPVYEDARPCFHGWR